MNFAIEKPQFGYSVIYLIISLGQFLELSELLSLPDYLTGLVQESKKVMCIKMPYKLFPPSSSRVGYILFLIESPTSRTVPSTWKMLNFD